MYALANALNVLRCLPLLFDRVLVARLEACLVLLQLVSTIGLAEDPLAGEADLEELERPCQSHF